MSLSLSIEQCLSPNHGPRAEGKATDMLLLHYTGMVSAEGAITWLRDPVSGVSAHYFVFEDGRVAQLVDERQRAWHAGVASWAGETDINSRSIGIELANPGHDFGYRDFPDVQIASLIALCRQVLSRHRIPPERVLAHSDVAPSRKEDPGERFPWEQLYLAGIGHWVRPSPLSLGQNDEVMRIGDSGPAVSALKANLRRYGYGLGEEADFDRDTEMVVAAFQRHFRPARIDGVADTSTVETLDRLIASLR